MKVGFVTFAGGDMFWKVAGKRIIKQARNSNRFAKSVLYMPSDLTRMANKEDLDFISQNHKGYGYWLWKPIVILDFIKNSPEIDVVLYADAGCDLNFNKESSITWDKYLSYLDDFESVTFRMELIEKHWTKEELFLAFSKYREFQESEQILGGVFLMNRDFAIDFCSNWLKNMQTLNYQLLRDEFDARIQTPEFKQHRHDQSFFSLMTKESGSSLVLESGKEVYFHPDWSIGYRYPIWTSRNKSYIPKSDDGIISQILRIFERIIKRVIL